MPTDLTGRELDAAIAREVMRQKVERLAGSGIQACVTRGGGWRAVPYYSTDANAARLVLAEIERRGDEMVLEFIDNLSVDVAHHAYWDLNAKAAFALLTASPEAICRAALKAEGGQG